MRAVDEAVLQRRSIHPCDKPRAGAVWDTVRRSCAARMALWPAMTRSRSGWSTLHGRARPLGSTKFRAKVRQIRRITRVEYGGLVRAAYDERKRLVIESDRSGSPRAPGYRIVLATIRVRGCEDALRRGTCSPAFNASVVYVHERHRLRHVQALVSHAYSSPAVLSASVHTRGLWQVTLVCARVLTHRQLYRAIRTQLACIWTSRRALQWSCRRAIRHSCDLGLLRRQACASAA
jgi:hypothetical protein